MLGFLGRMDEPRKGLDVLLRAFELLAERRPGLRLLVAGPGDADVRSRVPEAFRDRLILLGQVTQEDKARFYHSVDVFCAPNTGGESFGIVLVEAMAAGAPIVASDLDAFRLVLRARPGRGTVPGRGRGRPGRGGGPAAGRPALRARLSAAATDAVRAYDWPMVARDVVKVYEAVVPRRRRAEPCRACGAAGEAGIVCGRLAFAAILVGVYVSWRAGRLDRLHARVEAARAALDAALVRRSSVSVELAASGLLDPATSLLIAGAAHDAQAGRAPTGTGRERPDPRAARGLRPARVPLLAGRRQGGDELLAELEAAAHQVFLARKFYNDAVAATRAARRRWLVRLLRLAGVPRCPSSSRSTSPWSEPASPARVPPT